MSGPRSGEPVRQLQGMLGQVHSQTCVTVNINDMVSFKILCSDQGAKAQAYKLSSNKRQASQPKPGAQATARINKLQGSERQVQAQSPKLRGTSYKHVVFFYVFTWKANLVRGYLDFVTRLLNFNSKVKRTH